METETTADFSEFLKTLPSTQTELFVTVPLQGPLDLSILEKEGFTKVDTLFFSEGGLTSLRHFPATLKKLVCGNNHIETMTDLPGSLVELNCEQNSISSLDLENLVELKILNISNNLFEKLEHLPTNLEEIYCENNKIRVVDLSTTPALRILKATGNFGISIQNPPISLTGLEIDNTKMSGGSEKKQSVEKKQNYVEALNEYFRLKSSYDKKALELKRTAFRKLPSKKAGKRAALSVVPPCIVCGRKVGSIFTRKDETYTALCGDATNPCNLNIKIFNSSSFLVEEYLAQFKEDIDETKTNIIKLKMDILFQYISENLSVDESKRLLKEYNEDGVYYKQLLEKYEELYNNAYRIEKIKRKQEEIYDLIEQNRSILKDYQKTKNVEVLKTAVDLQMRDLFGNVKQLREMKYGIMEVDQFTLFQKEKKLLDYDYFMGIEPKVMKHAK